MSHTHYATDTATLDYVTHCCNTLLCMHCTGLLLSKGGASLKPFVPQLQTTFVKALSDPGSAVRQRGLSALSQLMSLSTRVDPLVAELSTSASVPGTPAAVRSAMLQVRGLR
jgi:hypothetical protein